METSLRFVVCILLGFLGSPVAAADDALPPPRKPIAERSMPVEGLKKEFSNHLSPFTYPPAWHASRVIIHPRGDELYMRCSQTVGVPRKHPYLLTQGGTMVRVNLKTGDIGRIDDVSFGNAADLTPDGKHLVIGGGLNTQIFAGDPQGGRDLRELDLGVSNIIVSVLLCLDNRRLLVCGEKDWHILDLESGEEIDRWSPQIRGARFAASNGTIAMWHEDRLILIDSHTGGIRANRPLPHSANGEHLGLAFSPSGRLLAISGADTIQVFDLLGFVELPPLIPGVDVRCARFSPDGRELWSWHVDGRMRIWSTAEIIQPVKIPAETAQKFDGPRLFHLVGAGDAWERYVAKQMLSQRQAEVLPELRKRLVPIKELDAKQVEALRIRLISDDFNTRRRAVREAALHGEQIAAGWEEFIQRRLFADAGRGDDDGERHFRTIMGARRLTERLDDPLAEPLSLVQLLPKLGGAEAREHAEAIAAGWSQSKLTLAAKEILAQWPEPGRKSKLLDGNQIIAALAGDDAAAAYAAIQQLAQHWPQHAALIESQLLRLARESGLDDQAPKAKEWIAQLDAEDFKLRERASQELARLGKRVEAELREALNKAPSPEAKQRLTKLLQTATFTRPSSGRLLALRLLEAGKLSGADNSALWQSIERESKSRWLKEQLQDLPKPGDS